MGKIIVKLNKQIRSDLPIFTGDIVCAEPGIYEATSNPHGALSIKLSNDKHLGIKPGEFDFIEAPAWVLEKHGKLSQIIGYDKQIKL